MLSINEVVRIIEVGHQIEFYLEQPQLQPIPEDDLKVRFFEDLSKGFSNGCIPQNVSERLPRDFLSGPLYFRGTTHCEAFSMVWSETQRQSHEENYLVYFSFIPNHI